jgi:putative flippase GtrA
MSENEKLLHRIPVPFLPRHLVQKINKFEKIILYGIIGGIAVVIDVGIFWLLTSNTNMPTLAANALSVGIAMVYSFLTNAFFNFRETKGLLKRFILFTLVTAFGYVISSLMLYVLSDLWGWDKVVVKNLSLPVVFVVQFILNSRITFKTTKDEDRALESIV